MDILRVSTTTDLAATAGAIAHGITVDGAAEIQVIGPRAVNQAVKGHRAATSRRAALTCTASRASRPSMSARRTQRKR